MCYFSHNLLVSRLTGVISEVVRAVSPHQCSVSTRCLTRLKHCAIATSGGADLPFLIAHFKNDALHHYFHNEITGGKCNQAAALLLFRCSISCAVNTILRNVICSAVVCYFVDSHSSCGLGLCCHFNIFLTQYNQLVCRLLLEVHYVTQACFALTFNIFFFF